MPLIKNNLEIKLREIMDPDYSGFIGFPENIADVANTWGDIVNSYASSVIPISSTSVQARSTFVSSMMLTSLSSQNGLSQLISLLSAYMSALSLGMQPAFTGTPPAIPINIAAVSVLGLGGSSGELTSKSLANIIHAWVKTGLATNNSSGATINWN